MARPVVSPLSLLLLVAGALVAGCARGPGEAVVRTDSAGVAVVHSYRAAWSPDEAWRLDPAPRSSVGGLIGQRPYEFTTVGDARLLPDGRLLVTHCSNPPELRVYGTDGAFVRSLGGPGSGPGQCSFILESWLAPPDTVILYDPSLARLTYFPLDGEPARTVELDLPDLPADEALVPIWLDRFRDGTLLGRPSRPAPTADGRTRAPFRYLRLDPATLTVDTLVSASGAEHVAEGLGTDHPVVQPVLFSPFTAAIAHGDHLYLADSEGFVIEEWARDGRLLRRFDRRWDPVAVDGGFRREYREQRAAAASPRDQARVRQEMRSAVFADHFPAHEGEMVLDPDGNLWVLHVRTPGDTARTWSVFGPDGRWLGEVAVPAELRVTDVGVDYVLGVWRDDAGVQTIRTFDLLKPRPGQGRQAVDR